MGHDKTGGPRGQLAVHPSAGQFVADNAACDLRPEGISAVDALLTEFKLLSKSTPAKDYKIYLKNGYLGLPDCEPSLQADVTACLRASLHKLRILGMQNVTACGLKPSLQELSSASHHVNLFYASAVPVQAYLNKGRADAAFQEEVSRLIIFAQYYGAMRIAALTKQPRTKIFLMPLGGGVFNNRYETIVGAVSSAIEALVSDGVDVQEALDIRLLTFHGKPAETSEMTSLVKRFNKLAASCLGNTAKREHAQG